METYQQAIERSKIPRINWKQILGVSMGKFVKGCKGNWTNEDIVVYILKQCRENMDKPTLQNWKWEDIVRNVEIEVSARRTEVKMYGN